MVIKPDLNWQRLAKNPNLKNFFFSFFQGGGGGGRGGGWTKNQI